MATAVLELKLGSCLSMRDKSFRAAMLTKARECNLIRNAVLRYWLRWREDNPDWEPQQRRTRDGSPKVNAKGKPVLEHAAFSQDVLKEMYGYARDIAPNVAAKVAAQCWSEVQSDLKDRVPYHHEGESRYVWQALISHERNAASYQSKVIPVPNQDTTVTYDESQCTLSFPLFSKHAGYSSTKVTVRLRVSSLPRGKREIVRAIAEGRAKLSDSTLVQKRGAWFFMLCHAVRKEKHDATPDTTAVLTCSHDMDSHQPWRLAFDGGSTWKIGDGAVLAASHETVEGRRQSLRYRYKFGNGAGHGRKRFYDKLRPNQRSYRDVQDMFIKMAVSDIVKGCLRFKQETLLYREPTKPLREKTWFGVKSIPMNWVKFLSHLKHKCEQKGVVLTVERMPMSEWKAEEALVSG